MTITRYFATGAGLLLCAFALVVVSWGFPYGAAPTLGRISVWVALGGAGGVIWLSLFWRTGEDVPLTLRRLGLVFLIGLAMRLSMLGAEPVLDDDWHRYAWDGATVAAGVDPYAYAPADAGMFATDEAPDALVSLAEDNPVIHSRINFPFVKTIYPPVAQAGFLTAHALSPFSLNAWRLVLVAVESATFWLLIVAMAAYGRQAWWVALYWWNPLIVFQLIGAAHMDALLPPFLLGAMLAARKGAPALTGLGLALAIGVKIWPILLAPALGWRWIKWPASTFVFVGTTLVLSALILWPQVRHFVDPDAGAVAYAETWRRNAFLFAAVHDGLAAIIDDPGLLVRGVAALTAAGVAVVSAVRMRANGEGLAASMIATTAALFFVSPTGYPWYAAWFLWLLPFAPKIGLGLLTVTLPLYTFRFVLGDDNPMFQWGLVPLQFGVPLLVLLWSDGPRLPFRHAFARR